MEIKCISRGASSVGEEIDISRKIIRIAFA